MQERGEKMQERKEKVQQKNKKNYTLSGAI